ncbi:MAG: hypothetical protein KatS3mg087_1833 [Patescibacteria group bacterium]|nr:MAG: hypothetical protein KatS3mg087_1833 [Patescibacteria group bacterium]
MKLNDLVGICVESARMRGFYSVEPLYFSEADAFYIQRVLAEAGSMYIDGSVLASGQGTRDEDKNVPVSPISIKLIKLYEEVWELISGWSGQNSVIDPDEVADVFICLVQVASMANINLESAVLEKIRSDEKRGYLHGNSRRAERAETK